MKFKRDYLIGLATGMMIALGFILLMGAGTRNSNTANPVASMTCSSDGSVVYISDIFGVFRSKDFGDTWKQVAEPTIANRAGSR